jgi:hypothetical protein
MNTSRFMNTSQALLNSKRKSPYDVTRRKEFSLSELQPYRHTVRRSPCTPLSCLIDARLHVPHPSEAEFIKLHQTPLAGSGADSLLRCLVAELTAPVQLGRGRRTRQGKKTKLSSTATSVKPTHVAIM